MATNQGWTTLPLYGPTGPPRLGPRPRPPRPRHHDAVLRCLGASSAAPRSSRRVTVASLSTSARPGLAQPGEGVVATAEAKQDGPRRTDEEPDARLGEGESVQATTQRHFARRSRSARCCSVRSAAERRTRTRHAPPPPRPRNRTARVAAGHCKDSRTVAACKFERWRGVAWHHVAPLSSRFTYIPVRT